MGFEELQSEMFDRDPCSSFMTESAWPTWGVPLLLTCLLVCFSEPFDRLRKLDGLSWWISYLFGFFQVPPREAESHLRVVTLWFLRQRAVVVGYTQAMSRLTKCHFI